MKIEMYNWAKDLFPINRSLTGDGVRATLSYIKKKITPKLKIITVKTGKKFYDWTVPLEWKISDAYIKNNKGLRMVDFKKNNLHVVGYSTPINKQIHFSNLKKKLHFLKSQPKAIPYRTSYYKKNWGFCLSYNDYKKFKKNSIYHVRIDSRLFNGKLNYGEILIKGKRKKEVLFSTNICHPSLGNNEISGPVLAMQLANFLQKKKENILIGLFLYQRRLVQ